MKRLIAGLLLLLPSFAFAAAYGPGGGSSGGTPGGTPNSVQINSAGAFGGLSVVNSAVVVTDINGVPSESTTLPSGLTIPSATLTTPNIGVATATTLNGLTISTSTGTLTITNGKTVAFSNGITFAGTDGTTMTFPTTSATIARTDASNTFTGHQTIEGVTSTGATGSGNFVFSSSPTFTGTATFSGSTATIDNSSASNQGTFSGSGGKGWNLTGPFQLSGTFADHNGATSFGSNLQVLKTNGSGTLTYSGDVASYTMYLGGSPGTVAASATIYAGFMPSASSLTNQGRYKVYVPKTGTIKTIIFEVFAGGGDAGHSITLDVWLNNATSVGSSTIVSNAAGPGFVAATGLSQAVTGNGTSGDSIELRLAAPSGMTSITSTVLACYVYIETTVP